MAARTADFPVARRSAQHLPAVLVRFASAINERREARKAMRRLMSDRSVGRETGARI